ncbi:MAG: PAS domain S-box protein, partial [Aggregatilineales bacterium]
MPMPSKADLLKENADLQARLTDAEETLRAIHMGEVDGLVVSTAQGNEVFTLQSADHPYRLMVEEMQEGAVTIGTDRTILYCNQRFVEILGYPTDQIISHSIDQFIVSEEREKFRSFLNMLSSKGDVHREFNCQTALNQVVPVYLSANVLQLEQTKVVCLLVTDLTERKLAEEKITRLADIVTYSNDAIVSETLDGIVTSWNKGAERIFGYSADEMIQKPITTIIPSHRRGETTAYLQKIAVGEIVKSFDTVRLHKDGHEIFVSITLSPIRDHNGDIVGASKIAHDITERKQAEEAIRFQARLLDTVGQAVIASNMEGKLIYWNRAAERLYGWSAEEVLERNILELTPAEEHEQAEEILSRLQSGQSWSGDIYARRKDGTAFSALITNSPIIDEQGTVTGLIGISMDITERKQAEEAIRFQAELLNAVGQAVIATDMESKVIYWNSSAERHYGWSAEEALGSNIMDLTPADTSRQQAGEIIARLQSGDNWSGEFTVRRKDGTAFPAIVTDSPIVDEQGRLVGIIGVSMDITERKQMEERLERERKLLRTVIDSLPDRIYAKDAEGRFTIKNEADVRQMGADSTDEVIGKTDYDYYPLEIAKQYHTDDQTIIRSGQALINREEPTVDRDGNLSWMLTTKVPLHDMQGNVIGLVGIGRDITERKRAVEELHRLNRTLKLISGVNQLIVRVRNMSQLFEQVCHIAVDLGGFRMAWLGLLDSETSRVNPVADAGFADGYLENLNIVLTDDSQEMRPTVSAIQTGQNIVVNDIEQDARMIPWRKDALTLGYRALAVLPLKVDGEARGSFALYSDTPAFFSDLELDLLDEMATDISFAMEFAENETRRLQAETELRDHMQIVEGMHLFLQTTLDAFPANAAVLSPDGTIINVNAPWINFAVENDALTPMHYVGQNYLTVCDMAEGEEADDASSSATGIRAVIDGLQQEFYLEYPCHSPFERSWFALRVTPFPEPAPRRVVVAHINVSERREAEEKLKSINLQLEERVIERTARLQEAKERVEGILNYSADAIILITEDLRIDQTNPSFDKMFGCEHDAYFDKSLNVLFDDNDKNLNEVIHQTSTAQNSQSIDVLAHRKDDTVFPAELTIGFIKDGGYVCVVHDISERKRIEQSLRSAVEKEKELNELKSRFVSMASHEFRTPLATIHATTETLSAYRQRLTDEQIEHKLTAIREQVGYLKDIMDDVLKLAQLQARRVAFNPATVNLDALCREIIDEYGNQVGFIHDVQYTC